jgi:hypothetical protein
MDDFSRGSRKSTYLRWAGFLLAIALLIYLLSRQGWGEIFDAIRRIPPWQLGIALLLTLLSRLAVAGRWYALLAAADMEISLAQTVRLTFAGLFAANFLPTTIGGDVVRLAGAVQYKLDAAKSTASLIVDRLIGLLGMLLAVPLGARPLWDWMIVQQGWRDSFGLEASLLGPISVGKLWGRIQNLFRRIGRAFALWKDQPRSLLLSLTMTWMHMLSLFSMIAVLLRGLDEPIPVLLVGGLWSFVYLITLAPISINGYGVQEIAMTLIFTNVGGISIKNSLTIALLVRTFQMLASLPGVAFVPSILAGLRTEESPTFIDGDSSVVENTPSE